MPQNNNPGQDLQDFFRKSFPYSKEGTYLSKIDDFLIADNQFNEYVYESCINYLVRRFIVFTEYTRKRIEQQKSSVDEIEIVDKLRDHIKYELITQFSKGEREQLLAILIDCIKVKHQNGQPTTNKKKHVKQNAIQNGMDHCYICGKSLDLFNDNEVEVEHVWPKALGGSNEIYNLRLVCSDCNRTKGDYIDASDFHYEEISLSIINQDDQDFDRKLKLIFRTAIIAKQEYKCYRCQKQIARVGNVKFARLDMNDNWHFFNIVAYCENCYEKMT